MRVFSAEYSETKDEVTVGIAMGVRTRDCLQPPVVGQR